MVSTAISAGAELAKISETVLRGHGYQSVPCLIQEGTLHQGDAFVCGISHGRVRVMQNHLGQRITEAGPSTPIEIFGLSAVPEPGTSFVGVAEEAKARQIAEFRRSKQREGVMQKKQPNPFAQVLQ